MLTRIGLAGAAAVIAAWFAVLLVDLHRVNTAAAAGGNLAAVERVLRGPQAEFDRRIADLRSARLLNPDTAVSLDIAGAYLGRGGAADLRIARRTVAAVLRAEPDNLAAWAELYRVGRAQNDVAAQRAALAHARALDPLDFGSR